jgi:simple sugar transport system ATP-binding protein
MILDEPTAVLSPSEAQALFASLTHLAKSGCTIVFISHKLKEVLHHADRITVMRRGKIVATHVAPGTLTAEELAAQMVGKHVMLHVERPARCPGPVQLDIRQLQVASDRPGIRAVRDLQLQVHAGEIVGIAAVAGNGQIELMQAVAGLRPILQGQITLCGHEVHTLSTRKRMELGLRYIPEDRQSVGTSPSLSVAENLLLRSYYLPPCRRGPWLNLAAKEAECRQQLQQLQISCTSPEQTTRLLSGGNIQKIILARELSPQAQVILAVHPTRGLDAWATAQARRLLINCRMNGAAMLFWSEDLEELLALSDRIAVMTCGSIVKIFEAEKANLHLIGQWMSGAGENGS